MNVVLGTALAVPAVGAVMTGIATLGSLTEDPPLSTTLPFFYGMWFVGFAGLAFAAGRLMDAGDDLRYALRPHADAPVG